MLNYDLAHDKNLASVMPAAQEDAGGILLNPAAFTHTFVAIPDALNTFDGPVIGVHISNVHKR